MLKRKRALILNAMETLNDNVTELTSFMVSAIGTHRELDKNNDDHRFKKLQRLKLVSRTQSRLPETAEYSVVQCLRFEAARIVAALGGMRRLWNRTRSK
eukprot:IDg11093t1